MTRPRTRYAAAGKISIAYQAFGNGARNVVLSTTQAAAAGSLTDQSGVIFRRGS